MSECWEVLLLSNLSISFFMSSVLTSEKLNAFYNDSVFARMLGWSLYLKIALTRFWLGFFMDVKWLGGGRGAGCRTKQVRNMIFCKGIPCLK